MLQTFSSKNVLTSELLILTVTYLSLCLYCQRETRTDFLSFGNIFFFGGVGRERGEVLFVLFYNLLGSNMMTHLCLSSFVYQDSIYCCRIWYCSQWNFLIPCPEVQGVSAGFVDDGLGECVYLVLYGHEKIQAFVVLLLLLKIYCCQNRLLRRS